MKIILTAFLAILGCLASHATEPIHIGTTTTNGVFTASVSRAYWAVEWSADANGPWLSSEIWNMPVTASNVRVTLPVSDIRTNHGFFRAICSWNIIRPSAGYAGFNTDTNGWGRVSGKVLFWAGNFMPGVSTGTKTPVQRTICFFDKTKNVVYVPGENGSFYLHVLSRYIGSTDSDASGNYSMGLPPGDYSVFVLEKPDGEFGEEYYYANGIDGNGYILPCHINANSNTPFSISITYFAIF